MSWPLSCLTPMWMSLSQGVTRLSFFLSPSLIPVRHPLSFCKSENTPPRRECVRRPTIDYFGTFFFSSPCPQVRHVFKGASHMGRQTKGPFSGEADHVTRPFFSFSLKELVHLQPFPSLSSPPFRFQMELIVLVGGDSRPPLLLSWPQRLEREPSFPPSSLFRTESETLLFFTKLLPIHESKTLLSGRSNNLGTPFIEAYSHYDDFPFSSFPPSPFSFLVSTMGVTICAAGYRSLL